MLRKLLKYDFKAVIKFWLIGALAMVLLSLGGGLCQRILASDRPVPLAVQIVAGLGTMLSSLSSYAFGLLNFVLIAMRIYKNFFTDEGYLTFTLPVKLHTLINSKLIMGVTMSALSAIWLGVVYIATYAVATPYFSEFAKIIYESIVSFIDTLKMQELLGWAIFYVVEALLLLLLSCAFNQLFTSNCITFGSVIAKKAKLLAAIGIYYGANMVFSAVVSVFVVCGMVAFSVWIATAGLAMNQTLWLVAVMLLGANALMAMMCTMLYTLQYRLLDRKLNLP